MEERKTSCKTVVSVVLECFTHCKCKLHVRPVSSGGIIRMMKGVSGWKNEWVNVGWTDHSEGLN